MELLDAHQTQTWGRKIRWEDVKDFSLKICLRSAAG